MTDPVCRMCHRPLGQHSHDTRDICNVFIEQSPDEIVGHKTIAAGDRDPETGFPVFRHEPLTKAEREALCPKDGSDFKVIELGSTGIFDCHYQGKWPDGLYMVSDEHDVHPTSTGVAMFKLLPEAQAAYDARLKAAAERYSAALPSQGCE